MTETPEPNEARPKKRRDDPRIAFYSFACAVFASAAGVAFMSLTGLLPGVSVTGQTGAGGPPGVVWPVAIVAVGMTLCIAFCVLFLLLVKHRQQRSPS